jgi:hypothetical protein
LEVIKMEKSESSRANLVAQLKLLAIGVAAARKPAEQAKAEISPEQAKVLRLEGLLKEFANSGCHVLWDAAKPLTEILKEVTGLNLTTPVEEAQEVPVFPRYSVVVPLSNPNGHDYPFEKPCLIVFADIALKSDGEIGNHLPVANSKALRYATEEEFNQFFAELENCSSEEFSWGWADDMLAAE